MKAMYMGLLAIITVVLLANTLAEEAPKGSAGSFTLFVNGQAAIWDNYGYKLKMTTTGPGQTTCYEKPVGTELSGSSCSNCGCKGNIITYDIEGKAGVPRMIINDAAAKNPGSTGCSGNINFQILGGNTWQLIKDTVRSSHCELRVEK